MSLIYLISDCRELLKEHGRMDLKSKIRYEFMLLKEDEAIEEIDAEMVVENLLSKFPEKKKIKKVKGDIDYA